MEAKIPHWIRHIEGGTGSVDAPAMRRSTAPDLSWPELAMAIACPFIETETRNNRFARCNPILMTT
jgi:hypothetical protein